MLEFKKNTCSLIFVYSKKRPSDFIVNEVDSNCKVVRLTNFNLPIDINKKVEEEKAHIDNLEENVFTKA